MAKFYISYNLPGKDDYLKLYYYYYYHLLFSSNKSLLKQISQNYKYYEASWKLNLREQKIIFSYINAKTVKWDINIATPSCFQYRNKLFFFYLFIFLSVKSCHIKKI